MKNYKILDVKTVDLSTFENYPGGAEFENEFKFFAKDNSFTYKFYDDADLATAEKRLMESNLEYSKFYGCETESDEEIKNHPAFFVAFSSRYDTLEMIDGKPILNLKKMKSKNFQKDIEESILVVTEKAKKFLEAETPDSTFALLTGKPKPFYQLTAVAELGFPVVYSDNATVKPTLHVAGKYNGQGDGRYTLETDALIEIAHHGLTICRTFQIKETVYPNVYDKFIGSGAFVRALKQLFDLKKETIWITPITIDEVE